MKKLLLLLVLFSISNFAQVKIEIIGNYFVASTANTNLINVDKTRIQFECFDTSNPTSRYYFLIDKVRNNTPYFWTVFRTSTNAAFASQAALNTWLYENTGTTSGAGSSAPLPSGAATEVTLNTLFKAGQNIGNTAFGISGTLPAFATTPTVNAGTGFQNNALTDTQLRASPLPVTGVFFPTTQPISATSLPLPTGAATSTNQTTTNDILTVIDNSTFALNNKDFATETTLQAFKQQELDTQVDNNNQPLGSQSYTIGGTMNGNDNTIYRKNRHFLKGEIPTTSQDSGFTIVGGFDEKNNEAKFLSFDNEKLKTTSNVENFPASFEVNNQITGFATSVLQTAGNTSLSNIATNGATSALQTAGNTSLSNIATNTSSLRLGQSTMTAGQSGALILAGATTTGLPLFNGQSNVLSLDLNSNLRVTNITSIPAGVNTIGNVNQTIATNGFTRITDGTNTVAIKPANTAATATDPSLVVTVSPNSPALPTTDLSNGSVTGGTAGTRSSLSGGIFNTISPILTSGQQASLQLDSNGRLQGNIIGNVNTTAVNRAFSTITDGVNNTTIKPSSVEAVVTDTAIVVGFRPSTNNIGSITNITGTTPTSNGSLALVASPLSVTTGGTAQVLFALNANRKFYQIVNNSSAVIWLNETGTAAANVGFPIAANGGYFKGFSTNAISIFGATTGQLFYANQN